MVDNRVVDYYARLVGAIAIAVYLLLYRCTDAVTHQCWPSIQTIALLLCLSRQTVIKSIRRLEEAGMIRVERRRTEGGRPEVNVLHVVAARRRCRGVGKSR
jgi:DNA-binding MarR family transcriptional regulator